MIQEWIETARELGRPIPEPKGRLQITFMVYSLIVACHRWADLTQLTESPYVGTWARRQPFWYDAGDKAGRNVHTRCANVGGIFVPPI